MSAVTPAPPSSMDTPMFRQYREMKAKHKDALLFYRMGDFYELFGEDAVWTAAALELTLTCRNRGAVEEIPMCGVPYHAVDGYLKRLLDIGRKVAIAEQVEDPRAAKGLVRREVTRVLTPGLAAEGVDSHEPAWLLAVTGGPGCWGLATLDASTGDLRVTEPPDLEHVLAEVVRVEPRELLLAGEADDPEIRAAARVACVTVVPGAKGPFVDLEDRFGDRALDGLDAGRVAVATLLRYAGDNLGGRLGNVTRLTPYVLGGGLQIDDATRRNLELFRPLRGSGRKGTVLGLLDDARTPMGGRLVREWLGAPLLDPDTIRVRQDAVQALVTHSLLRRELRELLGGVADLERIGGRVAQRNATPRDLGALRLSLERIPALQAALAAVGALTQVFPTDLAEDVAADLAFWLVDDPPVLSGDGGMIREGADPALDHLRHLGRDAKGGIAALESQLRAETGISSMKIRSNGVYGYYIEVTKANLEKVPPSWHRKQTIANGERFITAELKEFEETVSGADERALAVESTHFLALRERVANELERLATLARAIASLDAFTGFAELAVRYRWCRPEVDRTVEIELVGSRHPVVEAARTEERFVPNDVRIDARGRLILLTGPNMAGKSTLMRQVALTVLMAQIGCFVPAERARIGLCDRICVRVGASDDLARGQSTFMVEMGETANILAVASARSLVLLDEIGRGTSTYDGLAIAWAVAEDLHDRVKCRAIFATHYHELAALPETCPMARNLHVSATEHEDRIVFLRALKEGPAPGSYGIQCARLAGLPSRVVTRARELLESLERRRPSPEASQLSLFGGGAEPSRPRRAPRREGAAQDSPLVDPLRLAIQGIDPDSMSPREAMDALYRLRGMLG